MTLSCDQNAQAANTDSSAADKIAEIAALVRHSDGCPQVPDAWKSAYLAFRMIAPPSEDEIQAQEGRALALRRKIGTKKWCELYSAEMKEVYLIYRQATGADPN